MRVIGRIQGRVDEDRFEFESGILVIVPGLIEDAL